MWIIGQAGEWVYRGIEAGWIIGQVGEWVWWMDDRAD